MLLQFQVGELAEFLKYGISGLSAIAFILSFFLLNRESGRPKPRPEMLRSIRMFMGLTLVLGLVSGAAAIFKDSPPEKPVISSRKNPTTPKKTTEALAAPKSDKIWKIEIFYDMGAQPLAKKIAERLDNFGDYDLKLTPLSAARKKELKIIANQIRYESAEATAASQLQKRVSTVLPQDVKIALKQITSSSPNYLSIFVCD